MARKTIRVSDLTGEEIRSEENLAHLVVAQHPRLSDAVELDVRPEEVEGIIPEEQNFVMLSYIPPSTSRGGERTFTMSVDEFNALSSQNDMETVLAQALKQQQEEEGRRRGRRGRRTMGERRKRIDYGSPEFAGMPHRGRVTEAEKAYVRNNLDEVNANRVAAGHDPIDPTDPRQAERYGLTG